MQLEKLSPRHAADILQHYDASGFALAGLSFPSEEEALRIRLRFLSSIPGWDYRILRDASRQLVGLVGLHRNGDAGDLVYWVRPDARQKGIGSQMVELFLREAALPHFLFAAGKHQNISSAKLLSKSGFEPLSFPHHSHWFQWKPLPKTSAREAKRILSNYLEAIASPLLPLPQLNIKSL